MRTKAKRVTEYLLCIPNRPDAPLPFSGIQSASPDGGVLYLKLRTSHSRLLRQANACVCRYQLPVGILAAPKRFRRAKPLAMQAYRIAARYHGGRVVCFDAAANSTEYQTKY